MSRVILLLTVQARVIFLLTEEKIFWKRPTKNRNCLWQPCLLTDRDEITYLYRGPAIDTSYQVSVHLAKQCQRRNFFRNQPIRNKNCLWRPCLSMDRDEMSNSYGEPPINASYQVSVHFGQAVSEETFFFNWPIRNKKHLWRRCLLTDRG